MDPNNNNNNVEVVEQLKELTPIDSDAVNTFRLALVQARRRSVLFVLENPETDFYHHLFK